MLVCSVVLSALFLGIDYDHNEVNTLASQADLAASGVNNGGRKYLTQLKGENYQITWINAKGKVLSTTTRKTQPRWATTLSAKKLLKP